ncbi:MAG: enoyl-ACP reductase [Chloroflexota bacterium]|nr:enoyl-ACP reductase [Chloroflexota bacterium]MDE2961582.1 enoyl-ACP reductase [Chloroflexota bacterium]
MFPIDLTGRNAVIFGVANDRSIAWAIARTLAGAGARIALTYQNERLRSRVARLAETLDDPVLVECDAADDGQIQSVFDAIGDQMGSLSILVHSIAFANRDDLAGRLADTGRDGFRMALEISAFTLLPMVRHAAPLMTDGGSVIAMTFHASSRVYPGYNVMGTAKAALEHEVRQLAYEYGSDNIRVNAISAGPVDTLAARGISGFLDMRRAHAEKAPLGRNITADEVAQTALFLCSDLSSGVTGTVLPVDAGYHIMAV